MIGERALSPLAIRVRLQMATDAIALGIAVCELTRRSGIARCGVAFYEVDGRPSLLVDNTTDTSDGDRLAYAELLWHGDPLLRALREHHAPVDDASLPSPRHPQRGYLGIVAHSLLLPIIGSSHLLGSIRCGGPDRFGELATRELSTLATYVSTRSAELRLAMEPDPEISRLTRRQLDVAQLVAHGRTNAQISEQLGLSANTVKKHLKDIYSRLGVGNRTECAARLRHDAPRHSLRAGVTHLDGVAITCAGG